MTSDLSGGTRLSSVVRIGWSVAVVLTLLLTVGPGTSAASAAEITAGDAGVVHPESAPDDAGSAVADGTPFDHPRPVPFADVAPGMSVDSQGDDGWLDGVFPWDHDSDVRPSWFALDTGRASGASATADGARENVVAAVRDNPGVHLSKVAADSSFHRSTVRYHVRVLEDEGVLSTDKSEGKRRLYPNGREAPTEFGILADESPKQIATSVARLGSPSVSAIAEDVGLARSTVSYHLDRLSEADVVRRSRDGNRTNVVLRAAARSYLHSRLDGEHEDRPIPV